MTSLLSETEDSWYRALAGALARVKVGHHCLMVDAKARVIELGVVTDVARDGRAFVFAYEAFDQKRPERPFTLALRRRLVALSLSPSKRALRTQCVDKAVASSVVEAVYGGSVQGGFLRALEGK